MTPHSVAIWSKLADRSPAYALVADVDLVVVRYDDEVSVLYGRCLHRGALMSDGTVVGENLICGVHNWDYRVDTGVSEYANGAVLRKFTAWVDGDEVLVARLHQPTTESIGRSAWTLGPACHEVT